MRTHRHFEYLKIDIREASFVDGEGGLHHEKSSVSNLFIQDRFQCVKGKPIYWAHASQKSDSSLPWERRLFWLTFGEKIQKVLTFDWGDTDQFWHQNRVSPPKIPQKNTHDHGVLTPPEGFSLPARKTTTKESSVEIGNVHTREMSRDNQTKLKSAYTMHTVDEHQVNTHTKYIYIGTCQWNRPFPGCTLAGPSRHSFSGNHLLSVLSIKERQWACLDDLPALPDNRWARLRLVRCRTRWEGCQAAS